MNKSAIVKYSNKAVIIDVAMESTPRESGENISQAENSLKLLIFKITLLLIYLCVVLRGQLAEASSLLLRCRPGDSGHWVWQQAPLLAEPSHLPTSRFQSEQWAQKAASHLLTQVHTVSFYGDKLHVPRQ